MSRALRLRAGRDLLAPTLRSVRWHVVPFAALAVGALLWWQDDGLDDPARLVWVLRGAAVVLAASVAGALEDPTRALLAAVPAPLWWRTAVRVAPVVVAAAATWCAALVWVAVRSGAVVPAGALTVEAAAATAVGLALGTGLARWRDVDDPGVVAGPAVLCVGLLAGQLPARLALLAVPGPGWSAAHVRWGLVLLGAASVVTLALRDPARPRLGP